MFLYWWRTVIWQIFKKGKRHWMIFNCMMLETVFFFYSSIKLTLWAFQDIKVLNWINWPRINGLGGSFFSATCSCRNRWGTHRWRCWSWWRYLEFKSIRFSRIIITLLFNKLMILCISKTEIALRAATNARECRNKIP